MSRHNRRRTRASHRNHPPFSNQSTSFELPEPGYPVSHSYSEPNHISPTTGPKRSTPKRNDLSARLWHNRYLAWQTRERRQREERERLLAEQRRIFGGEAEEEGDDDEGLCSNMMEYFVGLDFIVGADGR